MLHSVFLLLFMLVAAPLAGYLPLAALAAVLAVVAWNMAEKHRFATLIRTSRGDAVVLLATFLLVVCRDLTEGILVGFGIGALVFLHRMAQEVEVQRGQPIVEEDAPDHRSDRTLYDSALTTGGANGLLSRLKNFLNRECPVRRSSTRLARPSRSSRLTNEALS